MKVKEQAQARMLRRQGLSLNDIARRVKCSKGSVSIWIRDIPLTSKQVDNLKNVQSRARAKAANHPNGSRFKWQKIRSGFEESTFKQIPSKPSLEMLKMVCAALYWAEGYKKSNALFVFANSDPQMIKLMMDFLRNVCHVPLEKLRGRVNISPDLEVDNAQRYWSSLSGIPIEQFHKPLLSVSKSSKQRRKTLPFGTFRVIISSVKICSEFRGWIKALTSWTSSSAG